MMKLLARFQKNESGATAIEYGLLAALIGVAIIAGAGSLGSTLNTKFGAIGTKIGNTATTTP
jgi:pilus assembly protein Flp/PilA